MNETGNKNTSPLKPNYLTLVLLVLIFFPAYFLLIEERPASSQVAPVSPVIVPSSTNTLDQSIANAEKNPSYDTFLQLGIDLYSNKEFARSIDAFRKATELNPRSELAWNNIAAAYGELRQWEEEIKACEKALAINPDFQLAKNNLAWAKSQLNK